MDIKYDVMIGWDQLPRDGGAHTGCHCAGRPAIWTCNLL